LPSIDPGTTGWLLPAAKVDPLTVADVRPLSRELGQYRILRTSPLVAAPAVCCEDC